MKSNQEIENSLKLLVSKMEFVKRYVGEIEESLIRGSYHGLTTVVDNLIFLLKNLRESFEILENGGGFSVEEDKKQEDD